MSITIGMAGKGGTGKTTLAGLTVKYLISKRMTPVLAVDADSNANLNEVLGVEFEATLSEAREEMKKGGLPGMTKDILIEMRANEALVESDDFDLIVMGRPEGPGCYCAANTVLTSVLEKLLENYPYLVIDNEAGMEHLSRLTTKKLDVFFVVSDASRRGLTAAARIWELVDELKIEVGEKYLVLNQVRGEPAPRLMEEIKTLGLNLAGVIPEGRRHLRPGPGRPADHQPGRRQPGRVRRFRHLRPDPQPRRLTRGRDKATRQDSGGFCKKSPVSSPGRALTRRHGRGPAGPGGFYPAAEEGGCLPQNRGPGQRQPDPDYFGPQNDQGPPGP